MQYIYIIEMRLNTCLKRNFSYAFRINFNREKVRYVFQPLKVMF